MSITLVLALLAIAVAYASVGHGGASGYVAILVLYGYAPEELRPLVLTMNVLVTGCLIIRYITKCRTQEQAQEIQWKLLCWLVVLSMPAAFYGGGLDINEKLFKTILGVLLLLSTIKLVLKFQAKFDANPPMQIVALVAIMLGFLSGLTGIGGGVLLSPLLIILGWSTAKQSLPIVSTFILFNSLAGLAGWYSTSLDSEKALLTLPLNESLTFYAIAIVGAVIGGYWSTQYANNRAISIVLACVLVIAGVKMLVTA